MLIVVNNGTHFLDEMQTALARLDIAYELVAGYESLTPEMLSSYSGGILTGGDVHVFNPQALAVVALDEQILNRAGTPLLGICLGHQLIAHHYRGTVEPLPAPVDQQELVQVVVDDPLFAGLPTTLTVRVAHNDAVTKVAPPLIRLARSEIGDYEAIRHETLPLYGLQFHPEASGETGMAILRNFAELCANPSANWAEGWPIEGSQ